VKGGADDLAGPAAVALVDIDFYDFDFFLLLFTFHGHHPSLF
jgi:hypothetical protein